MAKQDNLGRPVPAPVPTDMRLSIVVDGGTYTISDTETGVIEYEGRNLDSACGHITGLLSGRKPPRGYLDRLNP